MKILINNLRKNSPQEAWQVRVDRSSVLGNPFLMHDEHERNSVCEEYYRYFQGIVTNNWAILREYDVSSSEREEFMQELRRLYKLAKQYGKLELFCWCAPKRCHAETIACFLMKHLNHVEAEQQYEINITEVDPFDGRMFKRTVVATLDKDLDTLWYTSAYGQDCMALLSKHAEAVLIKN